MAKIFLFVFISIFSNWCTRFSGNKEKPLAQVGNVYLYPSQVKELVKPGLTQQDSSLMVAGLVEKWIRKQLILQKAELNLTDEEKNVAKELEEYRSSLIIYKYEQKFVKEKLDTIVSQNEIDQYYEINKSNFKLNYSIVKAQFIKLPKEAPQLAKIRELMKDENVDNVKLIESLCYQFALKYDYFNDEWVNFDNIKSVFPVLLSEDPSYYVNNKIIEAKDSTAHYLLGIKDFQVKGNVAPESYINRDVKSIILLKRKQKMLHDLENNMYFDALNKNNFTIYNN